MNATQKHEMRIMLNSYEDKQLTDNQHRILQGVLSSDFHALESMKYIEEEELKKEIAPGRQTEPADLIKQAKKRRTMFMNQPQVDQIKQMVHSDMEKKINVIRKFETYKGNLAFGDHEPSDKMSLKSAIGKV